MDYKQFLQRIIDDGIKAACIDYGNIAEMQVLRGSIDGFNACIGCSPLQLVNILKEATAQLNNAKKTQADNVDYCMGFHAEVEWVVNCVSAWLIAIDKAPRMVPHLPTSSGIKKAHEIYSEHFVKSKPDEVSL